MVNVLGLTFKENCPDLRNSKVVDIIRELKEYGLTVNIHDPQADGHEANEHYGLSLTVWEHLPKADAVVLAVAHREYLGMPIEALTARRLGWFYQAQHQPSPYSPSPPLVAQFSSIAPCSIKR